jgi:predicted transposase YdaD
LWISDSTCKIIYAKAEAKGKGNTEAIGKLKKELRKGLKIDRENRVQKVSLEIERILEEKDAKVTYSKV